MEIVDKKASRVLGFLPKQTLLDELEELDKALTEGDATPEQEKRGLELVTLADAAPALLSACKTLAEDCRMALSGEWDKGDEGFQASLALLESVIAKATGGDV